jgi:hypothetical protein
MPAIWHIYHVSNCSHAIPPKDKFVAIVCRDDELMGFLVNSRIHVFIQNRPSLLASQVLIKQIDYKFLTRDSYINCIDVFSFRDCELVNGRSAINKKTKAEIQKAVSNSRTIETRLKQLILLG